MTPSVVNLKKKQEKKYFPGAKVLAVVVLSVALTTLGIKAADRFANNIGESDSKCPSGMSYVSYYRGEFCIDTYEASTGDKCPIANPNTQNETTQNIDYPDCKPVSLPGRVPWRFISQDQAVMVCAKAGKELPAHNEWFEAALGTADRGSGWTANDCNVMNNWDRSPGLTGSASTCISAVGAYDMVGNVWEWVRGSVMDGNFQGEELPESGYVYGSDGDSMPAETATTGGNEAYQNDYFWIKKSGLRAIARGGYWGNGSDAGLYSMYTVVPPSFAGDGMGFRCLLRIN